MNNKAPAKKKIGLALLWGLGVWAAVTGFCSGVYWSFRLVGVVLGKVPEWLEIGLVTGAIFGFFVTVMLLANAWDDMEW